MTKIRISIPLVVGSLIVLSPIVALKIDIQDWPTIQTANASAPSRLGDLSKFKTIVADTKVLADKNDLPAAKARIKDLEVTWDDAESGLKPRDAANWHILDKAIDRALATLRASKPVQADCQQSLNDLLSLFDQMASHN